MATTTKRDIIDRIVERSKQPRQTVKDVLQEFFEQTIQELRRGNRLEFRDFGVFEVRRRAARTAQNPKTLQPVSVPAKVTVKFKVGRLMRESLELADAKTMSAGVSAGVSSVIEAKPEAKAAGKASGR